MPREGEARVELLGLKSDVVAAVATVKTLSENHCEKEERWPLQAFQVFWCCRRRTLKRVKRPEALRNTGADVDVSMRIRTMPGPVPSRRIPHLRV